MPDPRGVGPRDGREDPAVRVRTAKKLRNTGSMRKKGRKEKNMKLKKLLAIAMTAAMVMSMGATALADTTSGVLGTDKGEITITKTKIGESYTIYRIFDLASFSDDNTASKIHNETVDGTEYTEQYSYVISASSKWYAWLISSGYAAVKNTADQTPGMNQLFWIEKDAISLIGPSGDPQEPVTDYHVVTMVEGKDLIGADHDIDSTDYKTTNYNDTDHRVIQMFAQDALAAARDRTNGIDFVGIVTADEGSEKFVDLPLGYYLMGTSMGTLASLDTTNKNVTIFEKNAEPTIEKKVMNKDTAAASRERTDFDHGSLYPDYSIFVENTEADINDKLTFLTTVTAQQGALNYVIHDVMEPGLTLDKDSIKIYLFKAAVKEIGEDENKVISHDAGDFIEKLREKTGLIGDYTVSFDETDGCTFEIHLENDYMGSLNQRAYGSTSNIQDAAVKDGYIFEIEYQATLDENAHIYDDAETEEGQTSIKYTDGIALTDQIYGTHNTDKRNTNSTILTYGNHSDTTWDDATVTTYQFDIVKTKEDQHLLEGAIFSLYKATEATSGSGDYEGYNKGANALVFNTGSDNEYYFAGDAVTTPGSGQVNQLVSTDGNQIHVEGLEDGYYLLYEDTAPAGYNKLSHPILIYINGDEANDGSKTENTTLSKEGTLDTVVTLNNGTKTETKGVEPDATITTSVHTSDGIGIINKSGTELPSTGGIGTTIFYVIGSILVVGAGLVLVAKRRMTMN